MLSETEPQKSWLDRPVSSWLPSINVETLIIALILILAAFSRLYILGDRVMSHDETNHVVPSWELFQGQGYRHDPVTHGPLQFHLIAFTFFLLGDSDFTARLPAAIFSIAAVAAALFLFRRYLGRIGSLLAGFMFLISPYMLFYGRYTRNEAFIELFGVVMLFSMLAYLEKGQKRYLYLFTLTVILHFTAKETAYIYAAEALLFLIFLLLERVTRLSWPHAEFLRPFIFSVIAGMLLIGAVLGIGAVTHKAAATPEATASPSPTVPSAATSSLLGQNLLPLALTALGLVALLAAIYFLIRGLSLARIREERSFDLLILLGTLVLPLLAPLPIKLLGLDPLDYSSLGILRTGITVLVLAAIATAIGLWWNPRLWLANAAMFYTIFIVLFTTFFTNGMGFVTGLVGALGYWLSQQAVERGSQPIYYFALIQIPMYEYLPALGAILAVFYVVRDRLRKSRAAQAALSVEMDDPGDIEEPEMGNGIPGVAALKEADVPSENELEEIQPAAPLVQEPPVIGLLIFWSITSLVAYSVAGEKMPWLTVHIALPMILAAGWSFGRLVESTDWAKVREHKAWLVILLLPVFFASLGGVFASLLGTALPFQGNDLTQLQATATFLTSAAMALLSAWGLFTLLKDWPGHVVRHVFALALLAVLAVLTIHSSVLANYINYDTAKEYLVYAHAARGPKDILAQIEEISKRTTGGLNIAVAYDNESLYPFWWYLRDYPNKVWYTDQPTRELRNDPIILVGEGNYSKVEPIVGDAYDVFEYTRLWWPNQDYFNLTWDRLWGAISDPAMRSAIFQIWLDHDYTQYAQVTNDPNLTLTTWQPSNKMRMYIRKDIVAQIWNYGVAPSSQGAVTVDPYQNGTISLSADQIIGSAGTQPGQFQSQRGIAFAPEGSLYVADTNNSRIQHLSPDGKVLQEWGTFGDTSAGEVPGGQFNQPWDVAVGPDGSVYVADTWNNRIQKFTSDGKLVKMWGYFGQAEQPDAFWGPRGIVVDAKGHVYITDTGNKRVVIFDADGNYLAQFGGTGAQAGQFDEPVGIALDKAGNVYVADTWNQRVQVFAPDATGLNFTPLTSWDISGWYGQSLDNKPYIAVDSQQHVFVTDPEAYRVLEFNDKGEFIRAWGDNSTGANGFGLPDGIAVDAQDRVWVSDAANNRIMRFTMPAQ